MTVKILSVAAICAFALASVGSASAETTVIKKHGHMGGSKKVIIHKHD